VDEARAEGEASINGHAAIRVPNNPKAPAKRLTLTVNSERLPAATRVAVLVNGQLVLAEVVSPGGQSAGWTRTVGLSDFGSAAWLHVEIESGTHLPPGGARAVGAPLRLLSLER